MISVERNGKTFQIRKIEHMLHHKNIENVLRHGLLSHSDAHAKNLVKEDISMQDVQNIRQYKGIRIGGKRYVLHDLVPFYFNTRNPMLYVRRNINPELLVLCVDPDVINWKTSAFSDGNAASSSTNFYTDPKDLNQLNLHQIYSTSWYDDDLDIRKENGRIICAEILVHPSVPVSSIQEIVCPNQKMLNYVNAVKAKYPNAKHIKTQIHNGYFFLK